jgi:hypothetical protein
MEHGNAKIKRQSESVVELTPVVVLDERID